LEHLKVIMNYDAQNQHEIEYSRSFLQVAYHEIHSHLDGVASAKECDVIRKSLMGGRIYYHAARYGKVTDNEIKSDYEDRYYAYNNHIYDLEKMPNSEMPLFRLNSNEPLFRYLIKDGKVIPKESREYELNKMKTVCREDIQRIEWLREALKTKKVKI